MKITEIIKKTEIAGEYGSEDGLDCVAVIELVLDEDAEQWRICAKDVDADSWDRMPIDEFYGRTGRTLTAALAIGGSLVVSDSDHDKLLDALAPIADDLSKVAAGHSVEWDGSNHWGRLTQDAQDTLKRVRAFCRGLPSYEDITGNTTWSVEALPKNCITNPRDMALYAWEQALCHLQAGDMKRCAWAFGALCRAAMTSGDASLREQWEPAMLELAEALPAPGHAAPTTSGLPPKP